MSDITSHDITSHDLTARVYLNIRYVYHTNMRIMRICVSCEYALLTNIRAPKTCVWRPANMHIIYARNPRIIICVLFPIQVYCTYMLRKRYYCTQDIKRPD